MRKSGILSTIQDLGRPGFRRYGINPGGVMDRTACRLVNLLLGNKESDAVIEMHFPAAELIFESQCKIAVGGADFAASLSGAGIENWRTYSADSGSVLRFDQKRSGNRAYLAVGGGFEVNEWLGSRSTNLSAGIGGSGGGRLMKGDRIAIADRPWESDHYRRNRSVSPSLIPLYSGFPTLRVITGAEFELLDERSKSAFTQQEFGLSRNSDRMGFRLKSDPLSMTKPIEMVSTAVSFGTIQLLPGGQLILLMADHQTTGGYPRIAHVIERDLPVAAQLGGHDKVGFHIISLEVAEALNFEFERDMALFRAGCRTREEYQ